MNRLNWALQWNIPLPGQLIYLRLFSLPDFWVNILRDPLYFYFSEDLLAKIREIGEDEIC